MRYRKLDANGDYSFGHSQNDFYVSNPSAVAQAINTALGLKLGEWYFDTSQGVDWGSILGARGQSIVYDGIIQGAVLNTPGVSGISDYVSYLDGRNIVAAMSVDTQYGSITLPIKADLLGTTFILGTSIIL